MIPARYETAWQFADGLAAVAVDGRWGYVDSAGAEVIPLNYIWASTFSDGLARVQIATNNFAVIDTTGNVVLGPGLEHQPGTYAEGMLALDRGERLEYVNSAGVTQIALPPEIMSPQPFSGGLARVNMGSDGLGAKWGYIDANGEIVIDGQYMEAQDFSEGLAAVNLSRSISMGGFTESGNRRFVLQGEWAFVNRTGEIVIPGPFEQAYSFEKGLARVTVGDRVGYIDTQGNPLWNLVEPETVDSER